MSQGNDSTKVVLVGQPDRSAWFMALLTFSQSPTHPPFLLPLVPEATLRTLSAGWHIELDSFTASTPLGPLDFGQCGGHAGPLGLPATFTPCLPLRLQALPIWFSPLVGCSDSAVPCSLLLELAQALDQELGKAKERVRRGVGWGWVN